MAPFIPNFQSALQLVINSTNILETNLKGTFSETCTDAQNTFLRTLGPRPWFCCLKPQNKEQLVPKLNPEGNPTEGNSSCAVKGRHSGCGKGHKWWWHL